MKVLQVISSIDISIGGPARSLPNMCSALQKFDNIENTILTYYSESPNLTGLINAGVKIKFVSGESKYFDKLLFLNYKKQIDNEPTDIIHVHNLWDLSLHWAILYGRKNKIPIIISPRGTLEPGALAMKIYKKRIAMLLYQKADLQCVNCIHATANEEAEHIRKLGFNNPIAVIPNGINISNYPLKNYKQEDRERIVLFLSRIHPKKGIETLLRAWSKIDISIREGWKLVLVGDGDESYIATIKKIIEREYFDKRIEYVGPKYGKDKIEMYHQADIFILPTMSENFGMAIAEAMACGVTVITTRGTPWKILETHNAGWWVDNSIDAINNSLIEAISISDTERSEKGKLCRELVIQNFSIEVISKLYLELYDWLVGNSKKIPRFVQISNINK